MGGRPLPGHDGQQTVIGNRHLAGLASVVAALIARRVVRQSAGLLVAPLGINANGEPRRVPVRKEAQPVMVRVHRHDPRRARLDHFADRPRSGPVMLDPLRFRHNASDVSAFCPLFYSVRFLIAIARKTDKCGMSAKRPFDGQPGSG